MKTLVVVLVLAGCVFARSKEASAVYTAADEAQNAVVAVESLRGVLNDPDSLVVERVYGVLIHKPSHPVICIVYRARNHFNGYARDVAEYHGDSLTASTLGLDGFNLIGLHCPDLLRDKSV